jgi:asparagine synthase (glutamine-hydrolysing)
MRRAMTDILPNEIQWRPGKADFSKNFLHGMLRYDRACLDELLLRSELCVSGYVNVEKLRDSYLQLAETGQDRDGHATTLWLTIVLELWLRRTGITV